ncbi:hypothetical protein E6W36_03635 [Hankyongella ginsenosidimutans]|uniref:Uncharacterized protein n=1 Tax=Hankyongella ginsenosidimutans TaxID=1763828 RepID=A0A4D7C1T7_9SPHN|nr:hypothetical protein [Hankyongella ginsenosidimutans]QCI79001.1 hypothetical protein E6W36_03635 [Hankyongella ginsenosidimutans]
MPISFDSGGLSGSLRTYDTGRVQARAQDQALAAASLSAANTSGPTQRVNATPVAARTQGDREQAADQRRRDLDGAVTRESPTGRRPKFVAKGQSVNLLV